VGYILGLGDRHPNNLMLDRHTGKIVHIDFGDCFEVASTREKFPEKIPFRLTRMLINAMEVSGIEGTFRSTCINVLQVLRDNRESVLAVLEAFVHDPLINWRLLNQNENIVKDNQEVPISEPSEIYQRNVANSKFNHGFSSIHPSGNMEDSTESLNEKALQVVSRVKDKLAGRDFEGEELNVDKQVSRLILEATSPENLAQCWIGWCPFW
jgi:serine/threonine-protein kinase mTOR